MNETENQTRLRRSKEALAHCRECENEARRALASAMDATKRARENHEKFFALEEKQEIARKMVDYRHGTK